MSVSLTKTDKKRFNLVTDRLCDNIRNGVIPNNATVIEFHYLARIIGDCWDDWADNCAYSCDDAVSKHGVGVIGKEWGDAFGCCYAPGSKKCAENSNTFWCYGVVLGFLDEYILRKSDGDFERNESVLTDSWGNFDLRVLWNTFPVGIHFSFSDYVGWFGKIVPVSYVGDFPEVSFPCTVNFYILMDNLRNFLNKTPLNEYI
jgi:hypothetical protein